MKAPGEKEGRKEGISGPGERGPTEFFLRTPRCRPELAYLSGQLGNSVIAGHQVVRYERILTCYPIIGVQRFKPGCIVSTERGKPWTLFFAPQKG